MMHFVIVNLVASAFLLGIGMVLVLLGLVMAAYATNRRR